MGPGAASANTQTYKHANTQTRTPARVSGAPVPPARTGQRSYRLSSAQLHLTSHRRPETATSASHVVPLRHQQEALTLEEGQAGVQLPGAVAEGQGAVLGPGVPARGSCHAVLFQQNCNHLPKTVSARINTLPAHLPHISQELPPARHQGSDRVQGHCPAGTAGEQLLGKLGSQGTRHCLWQRLC